MDIYSDVGECKKYCFPDDQLSKWEALETIRNKLHTIFMFMGNADKEYYVAVLH